MLLKNPVFWHMAMCQQGAASRHINDNPTCEMSGTTHPVTHCYISEESLGDTSHCDMQNR
jgi:hypothetical protein